MPEIIPTEEQLAVIEAGCKSKDNLLINALAGAAKTSTLVMLAHKLPIEPTLSVAFNKRIADEMSKRMPSHMTCMTLNSVGHRTWGAFIGRRLVVSTDKGYDNLNDMKQLLPMGEARKSFMEVFAAVLKMVNHAKGAGYVPPKFEHMTRNGRGLITAEELIEDVGEHLMLEGDIDDEFMAYVNEALERSIAQAWEGKIDFNDQLYMPTLFGGQFPKFPITMVDEVQDLSSLNHAMLELMFGGRIIAVGDPNQAIYGFRGAHANSMEWLKDRFKMKELTLSTSFRCPKAVIRRAQELRVPHMRWPDWAKEGKVERLEKWGPDQVPDGAAIICRNNAPIFSCALSLIRAGRGVRIVGSDIGAALIKILKKFGPDSMLQADVLSSIKRWEEDQLSRAKEGKRAGIQDRAECLRVFAEQGPTLVHATMFAERLFASDGPVQLLTGHKSKGLEWDVVFHLDPWRVPSKYARRAADEGDRRQLDQEYNLRYVIETRPKDHLYLVNLEDFVA